MTCLVPTLFAGASAVDAAYDVLLSATSSATYATRLPRT
jgi:hypothetical protein